MRCRELFPFQAVLWILMMGVSGCAAPGAVNQEYSSEGRDSEGETLPVDFEFSISRGQKDLENRYRSTVVVQSERGTCSGVVVAPRLILTAAHCVCAPLALDPAVQTIGNLDCAQRAFVTSYIYRRRKEGQEHWDDTDRHTYEGTALVHNGFKAEFKNGGLLSVSADLAVVRLKEPLKNIPVDFKLAQGEVSLNESLVVVGYGDTAYKRGDAGVRHFGRNIVTDIHLSLDGNGAFVFRAEGAHALAGDSGGPCFREDKDGRWLVGINSGHASGGTRSWFTSTFHYRTWIDERIKEAKVD